MDLNCRRLSLSTPPVASIVPSFLNLLYVTTTLLIITASCPGILLVVNLPMSSAQSSLCKSSCGGIQINYPFGLGDGCGSPFYRRLLICIFDIDTGGETLELRTPSGRYPVRRINYSPEPHLVVTDPSMWTCGDGTAFRRPLTAFSLDASTRLSLSPHNEYLFFNCSEDRVVVGPRPLFCERFPDRCASTCDSASYLCRHLPNCGSSNKAAGDKCCSYYPKATESVRLMLRECTTFASVYWGSGGGGGGEAAEMYGGSPEYGVRVDFEIPVMERCLRCEDRRNGGGICGFNTTSLEFSCLCEQRNVTTYCKDKHDEKPPGVNAGRVAGTVSALSVAGAVGVGAGVWYLKKVRATAPVTHGVQSNENRLF